MQGPIQRHIRSITTLISTCAILTMLAAGSLTTAGVRHPAQAAAMPISRAQQAMILSDVMGGRSPGLALTGPHSPFNGLYAQMVRENAARKADPSCAGAPHAGYLHTDGMWVVDVDNCHVRLASVTWYGMQTTYYVPAGLDFLPYTSILAEIKNLGFNSIRIPITDQMVRFNQKYHVDKKHILANPGLKGLHPLGLLDKIVTAAGNLGLMIILDNHFSNARTPSSYGVNGAAAAGIRGSKCAKYYPTWVSCTYSQKQWIADWVTMTQRYLNNPTVIGFDLRNEPHTDGPGPWTIKTYCRQGATWGPSKNKLCSSVSDWQIAATKAGNTILAINPHLLMFVEGVELYPDSKQAHGVDTYWWGSILKGVALDPVVFNIPHQLVYSPHEWGPWKFHMPWFNTKSTYASMAKVFYDNWAYILNPTKHPAIQAPMWLGEFNTCNDHKKCVRNTKKGSQGQWWMILIQYLKNNPEIGWSYFPLNGTNSFDQPSNNSILGKGWTKPRLKLLMSDLQSIQN